MKLPYIKSLSAKKGAMIGFGLAIISTGILSYHEPEIAHHLPEAMAAAALVFTSSGAFTGYTDEKFASPFRNYIRDKISSW